MRERKQRKQWYICVVSDLCDNKHVAQFYCTTPCTFLSTLATCIHLGYRKPPCWRMDVYIARRLLVFRVTFDPFKLIKSKWIRKVLEAFCIFFPTIWKTFRVSFLFFIFNKPHSFHCKIQSNKSLKWETCCNSGMFDFLS